MGRTIFRTDGIGRIPSQNEDRESMCKIEDKYAYSAVSTSILVIKGSFEKPAKDATLNIGGDFPKVSTQNLSRIFRSSSTLELS